MIFIFMFVLALLFMAYRNGRLKEKNVLESGRIKLRRKYRKVQTNDFNTVKDGLKNGNF